MSFNINAHIILNAPKNIKKVRNQISKELKGVSVAVDIKVNRNVNNRINSLSKSLSTLNANLKQVDASAKSAAKSLNTLAKSNSAYVKSSGNVMKSTDKVTNSMSKVKKEIKDTANEVQAFGKDAALAIRRFSAFTIATGAVFGFLRAVQQATGEAIKFQREIARIQQVVGGSQKNLRGLQKTIDDLATGLGLDANRLAGVSRTFAQTGQSIQQIRESIKAVGRASLAPTFGEIEKTTEGVIATLNQFDIQAKRSESVLGSLNAVSKRFAVESDDLISAIRRAGGIFASSSKQLGAPEERLRELIGAFTAVRSTTRESADSIATGLRTIFSRIQRPSTIKFLEEFGVRLRFTAQEARRLGQTEGDFVGIFEALRRVSNEIGKLDTLSLAKVVEELGGIRQVSKLIPLLRNFEKAEQARRIALQGTGSLTRDVAIATNTLSVSIERLQQRFGKLVRDIAGSDTFQNLSRIALSTANAFVTLADALRPALPLLTAIAGVKVIGAGFDFLKGFTGGLRKGSAGRSGNVLGGVISGGGLGEAGAKADQQKTAMAANTNALKTNSERLNALNSSVTTLQSAISAFSNRLVASGTIRGGRLSGGGAVKKFANGGYVHGPSHAAGGVQAELEGGEYVIPKKLVGGGSALPDPREQARQIKAAKRAQKEAEAAARKAQKAERVRKTARLKDNIVGGLFLQQGASPKTSFDIPLPKGIDKAGFKDIQGLSGTIYTGLVDNRASSSFKDVVGPAIEGAIANSAARAIQKMEFSSVDINEREAAKRALTKIDVSAIEGHIFEAFTSILTGVELGDNLKSGFDLPKVGPSDRTRIGRLFGPKPPTGRLIDIKRSLSNKSVNDIGNKTVNAVRSGQLTKKDFNFAGGGMVPVAISNGEIVVSDPREAQANIGALRNANRKASGGSIGGLKSAFVAKGPGTGTSDSIKTSLPEGAFVINAASSADILGRRSGGGVRRKKFQRGGGVSGGLFGGLQKVAQFGFAASALSSLDFNSLEGFTNGLLAATFPLAFFSQSLKETSEDVVKTSRARRSARVEETRIIERSNDVRKQNDLRNQRDRLNSKRRSLDRIQDELDNDAIAARGSGPDGRITRSRRQRRLDDRRAELDRLDSLLRQQERRASSESALGSNPNPLGGIADPTRVRTNRNVRRQQLLRRGVLGNRGGNAFVRNARAFNRAGGFQAVGAGAAFLGPQILESIAQRQEVGGARGFRGGTVGQAGTFGALQGALSLGAAGAAAGGFAGPLGAAIGGVGGAIIGGTVGSAQARQEQRLFNALSRLATAGNEAAIALDSLSDSGLNNRDAIGRANQALAGLNTVRRGSQRNAASSREGIFGVNQALFETGGLSSLLRAPLESTRLSRDVLNANEALGIERSLSVIPEDVLSGAGGRFKALSENIVGRVSTANFGALSGVRPGTSFANLQTALSGSGVGADRVELLGRERSLAVENRLSGFVQQARGSGLDSRAQNLLIRAGGSFRDEIGEGGSSRQATNRATNILTKGLEDLRKQGVLTAKDISTAEASLKLFTDSALSGVGSEAIFAAIEAERLKKALQDAVKPIDALALAMTRLAERSTNAFADFDAANSRFGQSAGGILSTQQSIGSISRSNVFAGGGAGRSLAQLNAGASRVSSRLGVTGVFDDIGSTVNLGNQLPLALKNTLDSLQASNEFIGSTDFKNRLLGSLDLSNVSPVVLSTLTKAVEAPFIGRQQEGGFGAGEIRKILEETGALDDFVTSSKKSAETFAKLTDDLLKLDNAVLASFNQFLELSRQRVGANLGIAAGRSRLSRIVNPNRDALSGASSDLSARLTALLGQGRGPVPTNITAGGLLSRRRGLESRRANLNDRIQGGELGLQNALFETVSALEGTKKAIEELANDTTRLEAIQQKLTKIQESRLTGRQRAGLLAGQIGGARTGRERVEAINNFFKPIIAAQKASQGIAIGFDELASILQNESLIRDAAGATAGQSDRFQANATRGFIRGLGGVTGGRGSRTIGRVFGAGATARGSTGAERGLFGAAAGITRERERLLSGNVDINTRLLIDQQRIYREEILRTTTSLRGAAAEAGALRGRGALSRPSASGPSLDPRLSGARGAGTVPSPRTAGDLDSAAAREVFAATLDPTGRASRRRQFEAQRASRLASNPRRQAELARRAARRSSIASASAETSRRRGLRTVDGSTREAIGRSLGAAPGGVAPLGGVDQLNAVADKLNQANNVKVEVNGRVQPVEVILNGAGLLNEFKGTFMKEVFNQVSEFFMNQANAAGEPRQPDL